MLLSFMDEKSAAAELVSTGVAAEIAVLAVRAAAILMADRERRERTSHWVLPVKEGYEGYPPRGWSA